MEKKKLSPVKDPLRNYDALQDKHASFYFNGYGVKKHLRKLKRAIEMEPPSRSYKEYTSMLAQKLSEIDEKTEAAKYKIQPYESTLKPASLCKLQRLQTFFEEAPQSHSVRKKIVSHKNHERSSQLSLNKVKFADKSNTQHLQHINSQAAVTRTNKITSVSHSHQKGSIHRRRIDADINRQRSNNSLQVKMGVGQKRTISQKHGIKEVKHQDFLNFLRNKQQLVKNYSKTIEHEPSNSPLES